MKKEIVNWLKDWFEENGKNCNAIVSISGGKDSSVCAALCVEALGKDRVIGIMQPDGEQADIDYSWKLIEHLNIKHYLVNIRPIIDATYRSIKAGLGGYPIDFEITEQTKFNLPPRIRMSVAYAISQSNNGRVINTCNLSETLLGWETRWGDAVGDVAPLADLTVQEVKQLGYELGLPQELIEKVPSDGLCGSSDEEKMGISYKVLDDYIRHGHIYNNVDMIAKIDNRVQANIFKHTPIPYYHSGKNNFIASKFNLL